MIRNYTVAHLKNRNGKFKEYSPVLQECSVSDPTSLPKPTEHRCTECYMNSWMQKENWINYKYMSAHWEVVSLLYPVSSKATLVLGFKAWTCSFICKCVLSTLTVMGDLSGVSSKPPCWKWKKKHFQGFPKITTEGHTSQNTWFCINVTTLKRLTSIQYFKKVYSTLFSVHSLTPTGKERKNIPVYITSTHNKLNCLIYCKIANKQLGLEGEGTSSINTQQHRSQKP